MTYDKYGKIIEKVIISMYDSEQKSPLIASKLASLADVSLPDLEKAFASFEYDSLFIRDCQCRKGGSKEDNYILDIFAERIILKSRSFFRTLNRNKPLKIEARREKRNRLLSNVPFLITASLTLLGVCVHFTNSYFMKKENLKLKQKIEILEIKSTKITRRYDSIVQNKNSNILVLQDSLRRKNIKEKDINTKTKKKVETPQSQKTKKTQ